MSPSPATPPAPVAPPPSPTPPSVREAGDDVATPPGWRAWHARTDDASPRVPWVAATVVGHVRDARLGVHTTATVRAMAPLDAEGRLETAKGRVFDPRWFDAERPPGARCQPVPAALFRRGGTTAVERAIRDEVYRTLKVTVFQHRALGLVSGDGEAPEAFARRCAAEAGRRAAIARDEVSAAHAPRIQRAAEKVSVARERLAAAEAASPVGGAVASAAALLRGGRRALQRLETQQDRQETRREKLRAELADAEAAWREAVSKRDAELADVARGAADVTRGIERRELGVKRDDVAITEIGVAWIPQGP